jgi:hypothetical protein
MRNLQRHWLNAALVLLACLVSAPRVDAHALGAECKLRGNKVEVAAFFDDDSPAPSAQVRVEAADKKVIGEGLTDAQGHWSFARPAAGRYAVIIDDGTGHRAQVTMTIPAREAASEAPCDDCCCCEETTPTPAITVSEGPGREEFTAFPVLKIGIGVVVIGGVGLAFWLSRVIPKRS